MNKQGPFTPPDLDDLDRRLLSLAHRVVRMETIALNDERAPNVIGLRHDCDNAGSLATAVQMARWEHERGYRSSYYILHTSPYWNHPDFEHMLDEIANYGHEIGIHTDALAESFKTGEDPDLILERAIARLRGLGHKTIGVAGHGNRLCTHGAPGEPWFTNDEQFVECRRTHLGGKAVGEPNREIWRGSIRRRLAPRPLADFGLKYEALWLSVPFYFRLSDSGGEWKDEGFDSIAGKFAKQTHVVKPAVTRDDPMQLHILQHPDHWHYAFPRVMAA